MGIVMIHWCRWHLYWYGHDLLVLWLWWWYVLLYSATLLFRQLLEGIEKLILAMEGKSSMQLQCITKCTSTMVLMVKNAGPTHSYRRFALYMYLGQIARRRVLYISSLTVTLLHGMIVRIESFVFHSRV